MDMTWYIEPDQLRGVCLPTSSCAAQPQVLIQWKGLPVAEAT